MKISSLNIILFICLNIQTIILAQNYKDECERKIYAGCNHQSEFSESELESARVWLQNFMRQSIYKPTHTPCKRLFVRKNIKCLKENERKEFIRVIRKLYLSGVMDRMADIHQRYWPALHKTAELGPWHRWILNELEKEMRKISPNIAIPYYSSQIDAAHPEKSIVWKTLGTSGIHYTGYCVRDGLYEGLNTSRCIRRQWNLNGTVPAIDGLEVNTAWLHLSTSFARSNFYLSGLHFLTHLAIGGYMGDMSQDNAPYDIIFFLWHNFITDVMLLKLQLQLPHDLALSQYGSTGRIDQVTGQFVSASLNDKLTYYGVPLLDTFHVGFGELCSLPDQVIIAINQRIRNETTVPLAVRRLPLAIKQKYFPKFMHAKFNAFTYLFEEVGDCNKECRPIPQFQPYMSTENGRRQMRRYAYDENVRIDWALILSNRLHTQFIDELNRSGYCSPYVSG